MNLIWHADRVFRGILTKMKSSRFFLFFSFFSSFLANPASVRFQFKHAETRNSRNSFTCTLHASYPFVTNERVYEETVRISGCIGGGRFGSWSNNDGCVKRGVRLVSRGCA